MNRKGTGLARGEYRDKSLSVVFRITLPDFVAQLKPEGVNHSGVTVPEVEIT